MRIYKFKDLTNEQNHPHFKQIVLQNSIWCSSPDCLNDEDEFRFTIDYTPSPRTHLLLAQVVAQFRTTNFSPPKLSAYLALKNNRLKDIASPRINSTIEECRKNIGITSFSATKADERLWKGYGGKGNGACIEINIPDHMLGETYHSVHYVRKKVFHIDTFFESELFHDKRFQNNRNMLLTKTKKWKHEKEIRFIGQEQNVNWILDGYISEITFGSKVPSNTLKQLTADIADHCRKNNIKICHLL